MAESTPRTATQASGTTDRDATRMNAVVYWEYGGPDVLEYTEVARPTPDDDEVLVRVVAASVNAGDWHLMRGTPFLVRLVYGGYRRPTVPILGVDIAGQVEAVGRNVTGFRPGDAVLGDLSTSGFGGFAEYVCVPETMVVSKPATVPYEAAAAVPTAGVAALQALRDTGRLRAGESVLINGASGGVGTFAVQIARSLGAEVSAVCSTGKMDVVRSIGADHVIDYTREDFTTSGTQYDLIVDTAASHSLAAYRRALRPGGRYVMIGGPTDRFVKTLVLGPVVSAIGRKTFSSFMVNPNRDDLTFVSDLLESGDVESVIDRRYPLREVPEAIRYLEAGHASGKVVVTVTTA